MIRASVARSSVWQPQDMTNSEVPFAKRWAEQLDEYTAHVATLRDAKSPADLRAARAECELVWQKVQALIDELSEAQRP